MKVLIEKSFKFHAAHRLPNHDGKCRALHGHTYRLDIKISGSAKYGERPDAGMIMDFGELKKLVMEVILDKFDHKYLNDFYENPTAEIMVADFYRTLVHTLPTSVILERVRLWETQTSYAEAAR